MSLPSVRRLSGTAVLVFSVVRCAATSSSNAPTSKVIGPSGGTTASSDGSVQVAIPAGALPSNVTITVATTASPGAGSVGKVFEIGPTGTIFKAPVTMTFHYDGANLGGQSATALRVATFAAGAWQPLAGFAENTTAKTVSGKTMHLSPYAMWLPTAGGSVCAGVSMSFGCGGTAAGGGPSTGSSSGSTSSSGGVCPSAPTCATSTAATLCGEYPGSTLGSCTDGPNEISASCCFAPGAPLCFPAGGAFGCVQGGGPSGTGSSGSSSSSSGGSSGCGPVPTCASAGATACTAYPGASLSSCTDTTSGYSGACCFPSGQPVCVTESVGVACAGSGGAPGAGGTSSSSSSGGTTTCSPAPTCAGSNPCSGVGGATMKSCTDSASGYQATCCFAPGTLPPSGTSATSSGVSRGGTGTGTVSGGSTGSSSGGGSGSPAPPPDAGISGATDGG